MTDDYELGEQLGYGYSAVVRKAVSKSNSKVYAIKIVDKAKVRISICHTFLHLSVHFFGSDAST